MAVGGIRVRRRAFAATRLALPGPSNFGRGGRFPPVMLS